MTPSQIKADRGTETYNAKTGTTIRRDSGKRPILDSVESRTTPKAPKIIKTKRQRELWKRLISAMPLGVFTALDEGLMAVYVIQMVEFENLSEEISDPELDDESRDRKRKVQSTLASNIKMIGSSLGFDPISRGKIAAPTGKKPALNKALWGM